MQKYYDKHKAEFKVDETRKIAPHPLRAEGREPSGATHDGAGQAPTYTQAQWDAALAKAEKVRQEIANGADFATMAKENSDDPGTKDQGGDLGVVQPRARWCPSSTRRLRS